MHPNRAAALLAALALAACKGTTLPPVDDTPAATPVLAFSYGGELTGTWKAEGRLSIPQANVTTWAGGARTGGRVEVQAIYQRPDGKHDWVALTLPRTTPGSDALRGTCGAEPGCPTVFVAFGMRNEHGAQAELSCTLETGTLRLTALTAGRARGEFSGTGSCLRSEGEPVENFTIADGRFDVALH